MFLAIAAALIQFLGSSTFIAGLHFLMSELHASDTSQGDMDGAVQGIMALLAGGTTLYDAIENIRKDYSLSHHQALAAASSATALLAKDGVHLDDSGKVPAAT